MDDSQIDESVRGYFMNQELSDESVQRILNLGAEQKAEGKVASRWWRNWAPVAVAAAFIMVASFYFAKQQGDVGSGEYTFEVAGEIAMRHNGQAPVQVASTTFEGVQTGLKDLAFSVRPLVKQKLLSAYQVIGARYCQLQGQQAAHLSVKHRETGALCTLYIATMKGPLKSFEGFDESVPLEANTVDMWSDSGRLFALVD